MGRTPLFRRIRRALNLALAAERAKAPTAEFVEEAEYRFRLRRRTFVGGSLAVPLIACGDDDMPMRPDSGMPMGDGGRPDGMTPDGGMPDGGNGDAPMAPDGGVTPRVAIVGAGAAGLTCAYRLQQAGVMAKVFESSNRVGGRMFTGRGMMADNQIVELGGELIDTGHTALRDLAMELNLTLDPILEMAGSGIRQDTWYFNNRVVPDMEIVDAFRPVAQVIAADLAMEDDAARFDAIDAMSMAAYLDAIPMISPLIRSLLDVAYVGEYGLEIDEQSPWNLLWLIDSMTPDPFRVFGDSDEAFHIQGGSDRLTTELGMRLMTPPTLERQLMRVSQNSDMSFRLTFGGGMGSSVEEDFDLVVFALPFTRLRSVEFMPALPAEKWDIIQNLGMGTNAKLMAQFTGKPWRTGSMASGSCTTDNGLQMLWETSRGQMGASGILTIFSGGDTGRMLGKGDADAKARARLAQLEQIYPGTMAAYRANSAVLMHWPTHPHTLGSYTCYKPGQAAWSGLEGEAIGRLFFAGEHTSVESQGYMNGAVESGDRVAMEILMELGVGA